MRLAMSMLLAFLAAAMMILVVSNDSLVEATARRGKGERPSQGSCMGSFGRNLTYVYVCVLSSVSFA